MIRAPSRAKLRYNSITILLSIQILLYIKTGHVESKHVMVNLHSSQVCLLIVVLIDLETVRERHPRWPAWWFEQCADEFEGGGYWYEQGGWEVSIYLSLPGFIWKCDHLTSNFSAILFNAVHGLWHWLKRCVIICYRQAPGVEHLSSDIQELNNRVRGANLRGQKLLRRWFLRIIIYLTWSWPMLEVCTLLWRPWRVPSCHKVLIWSISFCKYLFVVDDVDQGSLLWLRFWGKITDWPQSGLITARLSPIIEVVGRKLSDLIIVVLDLFTLQFFLSCAASCQQLLRWHQTILWHPLSWQYLHMVTQGPGFETFMHLVILKGMVVMFLKKWFTLAQWLVDCVLVF